MRPLAVARLPEFREERARVAPGSTIRVHHCSYSVPSRLIGEIVQVLVYEDRLEVHFGGELQLACERLRGRNRHRIDYRHVIWSLVRKPGAFARYVYREEMFPSLVFRRAYDAIREVQDGVRGDLEYLRVLHLAASTIEAVKALGSGASRPEVPDLAPQAVDLAAYDDLLEGVGA